MDCKVLRYCRRSIEYVDLNAISTICGMKFEVKLYAVSLYLSVADEQVGLGSYFW